MDDSPVIAAQARQLLSLRTYNEVKTFRARLDPATARAVITHPLVSAVDRGAISLLINFGQPDRYGYGQGQIVDCAEPLDALTLPALPASEP